MTKGMAAYGGQGLYRGEGPCRTPVAPGVGDRPLFFWQGPRCKFEEKKLHLSHVAPHRATGVYFWNFPKRTYIFKILIFLNIKKKKPRHPHHLSTYLLSRWLADVWCAPHTRLHSSACSCGSPLKSEQIASAPVHFFLWHQHGQFGVERSFFCHV